MTQQPQPSRFIVRSVRLLRPRVSPPQYRAISARIGVAHLNCLAALRNPQDRGAHCDLLLFLLHTWTGTLVQRWGGGVKGESLTSWGFHPDFCSSHRLTSISLPQIMSVSTKSWIVWAENITFPFDDNFKPVDTAPYHTQPPVLGCNESWGRHIWVNSSRQTIWNAGWDCHLKDVSVFIFELVIADVIRGVLLLLRQRLQSECS